MRLPVCTLALLLTACSEPECPALPPPTPVIASAPAPEPESVEATDTWDPLANSAVAFVAYVDTAQRVSFGASDVILERTMVRGRGRDLWPKSERFRNWTRPKFMDETGGVAAYRLLQDGEVTYAANVPLQFGADKFASKPTVDGRHPGIKLFSVEGATLPMLMLEVHHDAYDAEYRFFAKQSGILKQVGYLRPYPAQQFYQQTRRDSTRAPDTIELAPSSLLNLTRDIDGLRVHVPILVDPYARNGTALSLAAKTDSATGLVVLHVEQPFGLHCDEEERAFDLFESSTSNTSWPVTLSEESEAKALALHGRVSMRRYDDTNRHVPQAVRITDYRILVVIDGQEGFLSPGDWASLGMDDMAC